MCVGKTVRVSQTHAVDIVVYAQALYAGRMKPSTVSPGDAPAPFDTARKVRGVMGEEQISASDLARQYGGAVSYWTRRITGQLPFTAQDLHLIGLATGRHPAEFMGGQPPAGWTSPPAPDADAGGDERARRYSKPQPSDPKSDVDLIRYGHLVPLPAPPVRPILTLVRGGAA